MLKIQHLKLLAQNLKIDKVGVAPAHALDGVNLDAWLKRGYAGEMSYLARHRDKRLDPRELLEGAVSVIVIYVNYDQPEPKPHLEGKISKYAWGEDYHVVLKDLLHDLAAQLLGPAIQGLSRKEQAKVYRVFVDSAPIMEKQWAAHAGIGWQGKHSNLITRELGSWGFLGELVTTLPFDEYDEPIADHCGSCTACIDACPTEAIVEPYVVDGSRCISYGTIELKGEVPLPEPILSKGEDWLFGCDVCQVVCPWNRFSRPSNFETFQPLEVLKDEIPDFSGMSASAFEMSFKKSPLERPGLEGMRRNQQAKP